MKTYLTFVLGIVLGIVIGFVIFTTTPIGLRYKYILADNFSLVRSDTWNGKASILSPHILDDAVKRSRQDRDWEPLLSQ